MTLDLKSQLLLSPKQVAEMFGKSVRWVYRQVEEDRSRGRAKPRSPRGPGFLAPYVRRFGPPPRPPKRDTRELFFLRSGIERLIAEGGDPSDP